MTLSVSTQWLCVSTILPVQAVNLCFSWITLHAAKLSGKIAEIVKGVAEGCLQSEAALIGGETAEHPGLCRKKNMTWLVLQ